MFEPLAREMLRAGVTSAQVDAIVRASLVAAGAELARMRSGRVNASRLAALTGLDRHEVAALLGQTRSDGVPPRLSRASSRQAPALRALPRTMRAVQGWLSDPRFLDARRRPKALRASGPSGSFARLVRDYCGDVSPRAILRELERAGLARESQGMVRLLARSPPRPDGDPRVLQELGPYLRSLLSTATGGGGTLTFAERVDVPLANAAEGHLAARLIERNLSSAIGAIRRTTAPPARPSVRRTLPADAGRVAVTVLVLTVPPKAQAAIESSRHADLS